MLSMINEKSYSNFNKSIQLFLSFLKIGFMAFGGGYSAIPLIEKELIEKKGWIEEKEILDIFALSESIPGSLSINNSILVGYRIGNIPGAIAAMIGTVLPSLLVIITLAILSDKVKKLPIVDAVFMGVRSAVTAIILNTGIRFTKAAYINKISLILSIGTVLFIVFLGISPVFMIIIGGVIGVIGKFRKKN